MNQPASNGTTGTPSPVGSSEIVGRRKQRVVFHFDERSLMSREQFEREMTEQGYKLIEVQTSRGTILIPDLR